MKVAIDSITVGKRRRPLDPAKLDELAESMRDVGLINPITVTPRFSRMKIDGKEERIPSGVRLIAGYHRVEAARKLGWRHIQASVITPKNRLTRDLLEIDENLIHAELSELERAEHLAARKEIYEQLHPETRVGAAQALAMNQALGHDVGAKLAPTFVEDTAAKTGLSERTIARAVHRAERIGPEVRDEIKSMPEIADSGVELDALAKAPSDRQAAAVAAVKAGHAKGVRDALEERAAKPFVRIVDTRSGALVDTGMTRSGALVAAAEAIARHVPNLARLITLLDQAGLARLAGALRERRPVEVDGVARPDPEMWKTGRLS
jgi:ParB family transcriptional regulator, chromosome partitioning protein